MTDIQHTSLEDRVVLITGGSRGFGWFIAEALLKGGAKVALTGTRQPEQLEQVYAKAEKLAGPGHCITIQASACQKSPKSWTSNSRPAKAGYDSHERNWPRN